MAKRKQTMTKNQKEWLRQRELLKKRIINAKNAGYLPKIDLPEMPKRVYKRDIEKLSNLKGKNIRNEETQLNFVDKYGESISEYDALNKYKFKGKPLQKWAEENIYELSYSTITKIPELRYLEDLWFEKVYTPSTDYEDYTDYTPYSEDEYVSGKTEAPSRTPLDNGNGPIYETHEIINTAEDLIRYITSIESPRWTTRVADNYKQILIGIIKDGIRQYGEDNFAKFINTADRFRMLEDYALEIVRESSLTDKSMEHRDNILEQFATIINGAPLTIDQTYDLATTGSFELTMDSSDF